MRIDALVLCSLLIGCQQPTPNYSVHERTQLRDSAPFKYLGHVLIFPEGSVNFRFEKGDGSGPSARLLPNRPASRNPVDARYYIELGDRSDTLEEAGLHGVGGVFYAEDDRRIALGDGYVMFCHSVEHSSPAYDCGAALRTVPRAAIRIRGRPASPRDALNLVRDAEGFLKQAEARAER